MDDGVCAAPLVLASCDRLYLFLSSYFLHLAAFLLMHTNCLKQIVYFILNKAFNKECLTDCFCFLFYADKTYFNLNKRNLLAIFLLP